LAQALEVEGLVIALETQLRHAGAAIGVRDLDTIDHGFRNAVVLVDDLLDFGGGNVLALPAEGIAQAVDELRMTEADVTHHVAGVEPGITFLEHVAENRAL